MATLEDYRSEEFLGYCNEVLDEFIQNTHGVRIALLATPDGFQLVSKTVGMGSAQSADNLSAVGSSIFALGAALSSELQLGNTNYITIDNDKGKVHICAIQANGNGLIFLLEASPRTLLAHILHGSRKLSERISEKLALI